MNGKTLEFNGGAGGFFVAYLVMTVCSIIPLFGTAFGMNYFYGWVADNAKVHGKPVKYTATYGEMLKFLFINLLLIIITIGIYVFWFVPKMYRFLADHVVDADKVPAEPVEAEADEKPAKPLVQ
jgi:uncharacterized membrane protein YjgN (DUF898 family)